MSESSFKHKWQEIYSSVVRDRKFLFILFLSIFAFYFTTRFEKLSAKSAVSPYNDLSFEVQVSLLQTNSFLDSWFSATYNWILTNLQGMFFGLWMASLVQAYFLSRRKNNLLLNKSIFTGALGSTVLGLCVNCAIPIAMASANKKRIPNFIKGLLLGSHALNFIIIGLMFSVLPLELALLKIISLFLLMALIREKNEIVEDNDFAEITTSEAFSFFTTCKLFLQNILKYSPFILLGGLLGNLIYVSIPSDFLLNFRPTTISLFFLSAFFSFLPVPLTFDIIFSAHLLKMGVPSTVAIVPLLTLGTSSILVILFLRKTLEFKKVLAFHSLTILIGFVAAAGSLYLTQFQEHQDLKKLSVLLSETTSFKQKTWPASLEIDSAVKPCSTPVIQEMADVTVTKKPFCPGQKQPKQMFRQKLNASTGLSTAAQDFYPPGLSLHNKFVLMPSFLSTGDWDADGFDDLLVTTPFTTYFFLNNSESVFKKSPWTTKLESQNISFFADVDNDGDQDIVSLPFRGQKFEILLNFGQGHSELKELTLPFTLPELAFVNAIALEDVNHDGFLDLFLGIYSIKANDLHSTERSRNVLLYGPLLNSRAQIFDQESPGETMSALFEDINKDGHNDLIVGNDYNVPDYVFLGDGKLINTAPLLKNESIPVSSKNTMSITSGDFNNDGNFDLFFADMGPYDRRAKADFCDENKDPELNSLCANKVLEFTSAQSDFEKCTNLEDARGNCLLNATLIKARKYRSEKFCDLLSSKELKSFQEHCRLEANFQIPYESNFFPKSTDVKQIGQNVLLLNSEKGFVEKKHKNLANSYWAWNSIPADFDNDGDTDLYVVNGDNIFTPKTPHLFYENLGDESFKEIGSENGSALFSDARTSVAADFNQDGYLDLLLGGTLSAPTLLQGEGKFNSISIVLDDRLGERSCVGCLLKITTQGKTQVHKVRLSGGHRSLSSLAVSIGLGDALKADHVEITWKDGKKSELRDLAHGHAYKISRKLGLR
jgi:uncharacterized membrane protein YraQ (UPF0718 family)